MTTTTRFTGKHAKRDAERFAAAAQQRGARVFIGKRQAYVAKPWQKPEFEYMVDVTEKDAK